MNSKWMLTFSIAFALYLTCIVWVSADSAVPVMSGEYIVIEAEDMIAATDSRITNESGTASAGKSLKLRGKADVTGNSAVMTAFYVSVPSQYKIWARVKCTKGKTTFAYKLSSNEEFTEKAASTDTSYKWIALGTRNYPAGRQEFCFNAANDVNIDCIFITSELNYIPTGKTPSGDDNYHSPFFTDEFTPVFPQEGVHPRLYVTAEDIPALKSKLESSLFKSAYDEIKAKGNLEVNCLLPEGATDYTNYSSYCDILLTRAFLYLIGQTDADHGLCTVHETKNFLGTVTFGKSNSTYASRYMGDVMVMASCVYDWCYEILSESDKQFFIRRFKELAASTEVGYPAVKRSFVISHAAESQIYRDQLAVGIAIYDEDPTWYNSTASIIFSRLLPVKNFLSASGNDFSGNTYAQARNEGAMHTERMVNALGYDATVLNDEHKKLYYKFIYGRLPNGVWFKEGDDYAWDRYIPDTRSQLYGELFRYFGSRYSDPYLLRQGMLDWSWSGGFSGIFDIISTDMDVGIKETTELPLTHFTNYPMSSMTARTSWQNGLNAPTAMAYVNMREVTVGDHQHRDVGAFQLYYKGMLALDSGLYVYSDHHYNYHIRSVAHNVMLVEDPDETYGSYANDGGQRLPRNFGSMYDDLSDVEESIASGECITACDVQLYSGPDNYRPAFSYISADIAPAYSDKISGYIRSCVFINLENEDYPAAFVVYDNLSSTDSSFAKKWLLHSEEEPVSAENTTVITRTDNGQNGKLTNIALLPENMRITHIGGEGKEFSVNSTNYPISASAGVQADMGKWRTEISPTVLSADDLFLNVMYPGDADRELPPLPVFKSLGEEYVSATVMNKIVLFPKKRQNFVSAFEFVVEDNGEDVYQCLFTGVAPGKWTLTGSKYAVLESHTGECCLTADLAPGIYTLTPADADAEVTDVEFTPSVKENFGDFLIRKGNNLMYLPYPAKLVNDEPYVAVDGIFTQLGALIVSKSPESISFSINGKTITLKVGDTSYTSGGKTQILAAPPIACDDIIYAPVLELQSAMNIKASYNDIIKLLTIG